MRIAFICTDPGVPVFGRKGSSVHCQEVIRAFLNRGFDVAVFAARTGRDVPEDLQQVPVHRLCNKLPREPELREKALIDQNVVVEKLMQESEPFDLVYERYSLWSFAAMQFASTQNIPGILEVNAPLIEEQKTYRTLVDESSAQSIRDKCFRFAKSIVAVSEQVAQKIRHNKLGRNKTTVISNGVNCGSFRNIKQKTESDSIVIGFVGTLKPWHGVSGLLKAFSLAYTKHPKIVLKIVGSGPEEARLRDQFLRLPIEVQPAVQWLGAIPNSEIAGFLETVDIAVAPYPEISDFYFSPLKVLEYMAAGNAIVASDIGQIPELLTHNQSGLLVKPGSVSELAEALLQLCRDGDKRTRMGESARACANEHHSWQSVTEKILATVSSSATHCEAR